MQRDKKKRLKSFEKYLIAGNYIFDKTLTYAYLDCDTTAVEVQKVFGSNYSILKHDKFSIKAFVLFFIRKALLANIQIGIADTKLFQGSACLISSLEKNIKIFDFYNKEIMIFFPSYENFSAYNKTYSVFANYFHIPSILKMDENVCMITEEMIVFKPTSLWVESDYNLVVSDYFDKMIRYSENAVNEGNFRVSTNRDFIKTLKNFNQIEVFIKENHVDKLLDINFPHINIHGDLWSSNILYRATDEKVFYVDWERSKEKIFFYDFFSLIWNEAYLKGKGFLIDQYIKGQWDEELQLLFEVFNLKYDRYMKKAYFALFLIIYLIEWHGVVDSNRVENYLKLFREFT